jgi:hypothetical protein
VFIRASLLMVFLAMRRMLCEDHVDGFIIATGRVSIELASNSLASPPSLGPARVTAHYKF